MARRRMIHPEIWESEDFSKLSTLAKLVFIGMFSLADDEGKGRGKPVYLKSVVFPYDDEMQVVDIERALSEISSNMSATFYTHNENDYYKLDNWNIWQRVDKPQPSKIPDPPVGENHSGTIPESVGNDSRLKEKKDTMSGAALPDDTYAIISHLNSVCGTNFRLNSKTTQEHINARLNEGYKLDDFIAVIDKKHFEWSNRPDMAQYLRPTTLFGTKFESYLNQPWTDGRRASSTDIALRNFVSGEKDADIIEADGSEVDGD